MEAQVPAKRPKAKKQTAKNGEAPRRRRIDSELRLPANNQMRALARRAEAACWAVLLAVALSWAGPPAALAAQKAHKTIKGLDDVYILKSDDRKHAILLAACMSCHGDTEFNFWMLVYGDQEPRVEAEVGEAIPRGRSAMPGYMEAGRKGTWDYPNSHDYFECEFCHLGAPSMDGKEKPTFTMPVRDLCAPCHADTETLHIYDEGDNEKRVALEALLKHDLPTDDGDVLCLTCHQVHNAIYSVRPGYIKAEIAERPVDPHGGKLYCLLCHEGKLDDPVEVTIRKGGDLNELCSECHRGLGKGGNHHPTDVSIGEETWKLGFINFPFPNGVISCSTCHDETCYLPRDAENPAFLRGGPYSSESEFCFRCHSDDRAETLNPHDQFHSVGLLKVDTCLTCHTSVPKREEKAGDSHELIDEVVFLCQRCHAEESPHPTVNHLVRIPRDMSKMKTAYEEKHRVLLPLGKGGMIVCTTCHNPHDKGVLKGEKGVGAGEVDLLRLPDFNENCAPCHGDHR